MPVKDTIERQPISIEKFVNSDKFNQLSLQAQQTARLVVMFGSQQEQQALLDDKKRTIFLNYAYVGWHETGHGLAAIEAGGTNVRKKILGIGEGVTTWMHSFKNSVSQFFLERMFVSFAGRKAIEVLGFTSKGHATDMGQIETQAALYERLTGKSGTGLKNQAENWAESFVSHHRNRILKEGFRDALAA